MAMASLAPLTPAAPAGPARRFATATLDALLGFLTVPAL